MLLVLFSFRRYLKSHDTQKYTQNFQVMQLLATVFTKYSVQLKQVLNRSHLSTYVGNGDCTEQTSDCTQQPADADNLPITQSCIATGKQNP